MTVAETLQQDDGEPIVIHDSPLPDQAWAAFRQLLPLITAWLVLKGYISGELEQIVICLVGVVLPIVWGQLKTRLRALQLKRVEPALPDSILTTKAKAVTK